MTAQKLAEALENIFQEENDRLLNSVRALQAEAVRELSRLIERPRAGLITDENGKVIVSGKDGAENRARIGRIKAILKTFIQGARGKPGKLDKAKESYLNAFKAIEEVQARYFKENFKAFEVRPLKALTKAAQFRTAELLSTGLTQELTTPLYLILDQALRGASLKEINERAREELETTFSSGGGGRRQEVKSRGRLESYANRIVRDTLNNFSGNLTTATAESLGLEWFYYSAGKVQGSRPFCLEREGKYFHREEVERWAALSWEGKNPQTNEDNILALRGGYNCMHSIIPVSKDAIPENRDKVVKPPAESGREAPEQAQESQAFVIPKTYKEAIENGKPILTRAKEISKKKNAGELTNKINKLKTERRATYDDYEALKKKLPGNWRNRPEEYKELLAEIEKKRIKHNEKLKEVQNAKKALAKAAEDVVKLFLKDEKADINYIGGSGSRRGISAKDLSKKFKDWGEEFKRFIGPNYALDQNSIFVVSGRGYSRAHARKKVSFSRPESGIFVNASVEKETFMHELGHVFEFQNPGVFGLIKEFFKERTKGEAPQRLRDLTGVNYSASEIAKKDKFFKVYMGKIYRDGHTELLPMFLTAIYTGEVFELIEKDPEYFQFFAGIFGRQ